MMAPQPEDRPSRVDILPTLPSPSTIYRAALARSARAVVLRRPSVRNVVSDLALATGPVRLDSDRMDRYCRLVGVRGSGPEGNQAPPGFVHISAFGLQLALLARPEFPLPMLGLVHTANRITQLHPVTTRDSFAVTSWARRLALRPLADGSRGTQVEVVTEWRSTGEDGPVVWRGVSTYLAKGVALPGLAEVTAPPREDFEPQLPTGGWATSRAASREYADVSGDENPIHTSRLAARAFGFPRTIAHGMDTAARALAPLASQRGEQFTWSVDFAAPALVPGRVALRVARHDAEEAAASWGMTVWDPRRGKLHVAATLASE